jgi:hypothetical protein
MGVDMKSRTSAALRIRAICEIHHPADFYDHVFLSGCDVFFPCGLSHVMGVFCGWSLSLSF